MNEPGIVPPHAGAVAVTAFESRIPAEFLARMKYVYVDPEVTFDPVFKKVSVFAGTPGEYRLPFR
jgi:hypothetical protein